VLTRQQPRRSSAIDSTSRLNFKTPAPGPVVGRHMAKPVRPMYGVLGAPKKVTTPVERRRGVFIESKDTKESAFLTGIEGFGAVGEKWGRILCRQVCTMGFIYTAVVYWWKQSRRRHTPGYE
jgi:hypothetical protein